MGNQLNLTWSNIETRAYMLVCEIQEHIKLKSPSGSLYGIPRGGIFAAQMVYAELRKRGVVCCLTEKVGQADVFIDDIIDTGKTRDKYLNDSKGKIPFYALVDYQGRDKSRKGTWISFPWERMNNDDGPTENIRRVLEYIGEDPDREGLKDTPNRVIKSYEKLFAGYKQNPKDVMKTFQDPCDEMALLKDIEFYSNCEHHLLPFYGKAHIAYIPNGKVIGISKLARVLEIYSRRLQIQERLCQQVTQAIEEILQPKGAACILEARHLCMIARGVEKQNSVMITSSLTGVFKTNIDTRSEFMSMIGK